MEVLQVLHMNGSGEGRTSYAKNCTVQRKIISVGETMIKEAVEKMMLSNSPKSVGIADLGCSSGPNTMTVVLGIMDVVCKSSLEMKQPFPEFRISLNDLPGNDFNYIFVSLPTFYEKLKKEKSIERCYISGVAGSFYGRLFPDKTLHFVHSSSSIHWLSQVPGRLGKKEIINKGKLYISESSPASVYNTYLSQYQQDFSLFLKSRSEEMVSGGHMILSFMSRSSPCPSSPDGCYQWELLARTLSSMASEGLVEEEKIDTFNAPYYAPSKEEVKLEIEKEGSFLIDRFEEFEIDWDGRQCGVDNSKPHGQFLDASGNMLTSGEIVAKTIRAVVESMFKSHFGFGTQILDEIFTRYAKIVDQHISTTRAYYSNIIISLVKKDEK